MQEYILPLWPVLQQAQTECGDPASAVCCCAVRTNGCCKATLILLTCVNELDTMQEAAADQRQTQLYGVLACQLLKMNHQLGCVWQPQICLTAPTCRCKVTKVAGCTCWKFLSGPCRLTLDILLLYIQTGQLNFVRVDRQYQYEYTNCSATMTASATVHSIVLLCKQTHEAECDIGLLFADTSFCLADLRLLCPTKLLVLL